MMRSSLRITGHILQWGGLAGLAIGTWELARSGRWAGSELLATGVLELYIWLALAGLACRLLAEVGAGGDGVGLGKGGGPRRRRRRGEVRNRRSRPEPLPELPLEQFTPNLAFEGDMPPARPPDPTRVAPLTTGEPDMPHTAPMSDVPAEESFFAPHETVDAFDDDLAEPFDDEELDGDEDEDELWEDDDELDDDEWDDPLDEDDEEDDDEDEEDDEDEGDEEEDDDEEDEEEWDDDDEQARRRGPAAGSDRALRERIAASWTDGAGEGTGGPSGRQRAGARSRQIARLIAEARNAERAAAELRQEADRLRRGGDGPRHVYVGL